MKVRRVIEAVVVLGLLLSLGASAEARSSSITRGACHATISNWHDVHGTHAYSYRTSAGSTSCGYMEVSHIFYFGGTPQLGSLDKDYRYARSNGWDNPDTTVAFSDHFLRDGTIPDPGYRYRLWG